ncbi:hypothetical protein HY945_03710 [Candidatus Gottesmanbacteria bacterium]|nr:hypothetical protein [Candidatus Gottesmanbacteria bacterium]
MEQLRIRAFDRVTLRGPAKMSPEKVLRRAETVFAFAQQRAEDGNHKYMEVLRDQAA